jgi:signal transduction histidine kinase
MCTESVVVLGGLGYHIAQLQLLHIERFSQTVFIAQILYALVLGFAKLSIATNFQRVFFTRGFRMAAYASMALSIAWMLQTILIGLLICQPINLNWSPTARGSCGDQTAAFTSVSVVDIITDVVLLVLPIRPLMELRVKKAQRVALAVIFSGGFM